MREQAGEQFHSASENIQKPENETVKKVKEALGPFADKMNSIGGQVKEKVAKVGGKGLDYIQSNLKHLQDEKKTGNLEAWQKRKAAMDKYISIHLFGCSHIWKKRVAYLFPCN